jgi:hypothetical protein
MPSLLSQMNEDEWAKTGSTLGLPVAIVIIAINIGVLAATCTVTTV